MPQANPAAVGARNRNNLTPLHFALGCTTVEINAPAKTILELLDVFPEAARVKNACAELPLHIAVAKRAPLEVLSRLVDIYPGACIECNCWGSLPLHVGLVNNLQWAEIRLLVEAAGRGFTAARSRALYGPSGARRAAQGLTGRARSLRTP